MTAASPSLITFSLRTAESTDLNFVYDTWLNSYRFVVEESAKKNCQACGKPCGHLTGREINGAAAVAEMRTDDYFRLQRQRIDSLLANSAFIMVAHPDGTPNVIAAWACLDVAPAVFHYVYAREFHRKKRLATRLIGDRKICTHLTDSRRPDSFAAWKRRSGIRYMPHLLDAT